MTQDKINLPSDLDEAAEKYIQSLDGYPANQEEEMFVYKAFKAGAEWMASKLIPVTPSKGKL